MTLTPLSQGSHIPIFLNRHKTKKLLILVWRVHTGVRDGLEHSILMFCAQPNLILTLELFICDNNKTICLSFSHPCAWHHGDNKMGKMYLNSLEIGALPVTDAINWYCLIVRWCQHIHWLAAEPVPVLGSITKTGWGSRKDPVQNKWIHPGRL